MRFRSLSLFLNEIESWLIYIFFVVDSNRLLRKFCILSFPDPSAKSLLNIYQVRLGRYFTECEFNIEIKSNLFSIVSASIVMFYRVLINMLPTPSKSHYIFNLRDLSRLVNGLMQSSPTVIITRENLVDLFGHECIRVFNDRLVSVDDNATFYFHLNETIFDYFKIDFPNPYNSNKKSGVKGNNNNNALQNPSTSSIASSIDDESRTTLLYGDFIKNEERVYQPFTNWKQLVSVLSEYQMRSNMTGHVSRQLVFFREAVEHLCR